jgi:hypothetical protein
LQGNCGGGDLETMLRDYYRMNVGADNLDIEGSTNSAGKMERQRSKHKELFRQSSNCLIGNKEIEHDCSRDTQQLSI